DLDYFKVEATKGQKLRIQGQGRSVGSAIDLYLRILAADGKQLAVAEDAGLGEGVLSYAVPADGSYYVVAEDLLRRGDPGLVYRLEATLEEPGFALTLEVDRLNPPQGGVFTAKVVAARSGYTGPIELALEGIDGATLAANTI